MEADLRQEITEGFRRMENVTTGLEALARGDHDLLIRLEGQFTGAFQASVERTADHEKRIRFLERITFGLLAVLMVLQFVGRFLPGARGN